MPTLSVSILSAALLSAAFVCGTPAVIAAQQAAPHAPAATASTPQAVPAPVEAPAGAATSPTSPATAQPAPAAADAAPGAATPAASPAGTASAPVEGAQPAASTPAAPEHGAAAPSQAGAAPQHGEGQAAEHGEEHAESPWGLIARIVNFVILVGALVYFLRTPLGSYLTSRSEQIRTDLVTAKNTTTAATAQLAEIDARLKALPAELETLKKRGAEEIAAEEARIKQTAEAERHRLLEQTRREIELQVRLAKRDLTDYAATLAVDLATDRIKQTVTDTDQQRLIDRYVTQVRTAHE